MDATEGQGAPPRKVRRGRGAGRRASRSTQPSPEGAHALLKRPDVVMSLSFEAWTDLVEREFARPPDRLARYLIRSGDTGRVLIADAWRSWPIRLVRRL